ncbi:EVE domain-containing protein [Alteromonas gilva]|uniref:EVE domain-containing protein n=1 Tax=Alteromonas gilva TaxID=2987522 RepID=A0ABT5L154_9ALTE|nr:EVE domain-containing protein [Alteromonas gilva]MDC8830776.1 EVE domain-containing protein [Alteromonas gilva]
MQYWLFKSEPDVFGIAHLANRPDQTEPWDGVRNYQARNFLRDEVGLGDRVFFYHSSCKTVGIAGVVEIVRAGYADPSQFDPESDYYDPKASREKPRWYSVDVKLVECFDHILTLKDIKANPHIRELGLVKKGHRLSVMPVTHDEWQVLYGMAKA